MLPVYTVKNPKLIQCNGLYYFEDFVTQKYSKIGIKYLKKNIMLNNEFKFGFGFFEILTPIHFQILGAFIKTHFFTVLEATQKYDKIKMDIAYFCFLGKAK